MLAMVYSTLRCITCVMLGVQVMEDLQLNEGRKEQVMAHLLAGLQAQVRSVLEAWLFVRDYTACSCTVLFGSC